MNSQTFDLVILSNGPGEITTWVKPVVSSLREQWADRPGSVRISVVLSPCSNSTGNEAKLAASYPEVDRVQAAEHFFPFLLWGKTADNWDWYDRGLVLFLGGDQFYTLVIGKRLGYRMVIYAEWEARWYRWVDRLAVMKAAVAEAIPQPYATKATIVGDLMTGVQTAFPATDLAQPGTSPIVGLLPGSKAHKLKLGVPLMLAIVQQIHQALPNARFVIPVAPTIDTKALGPFADPAQNPVITDFGWGAGELVHQDDRATLRTYQGSTPIDIELHAQFPAHELLAQCHLCFTTVGANTAELGALGVPMIVLLPTQQLDVMKTWDGFPGIIANLPLVGSGFAKLFNRFMLRRLGLLGDSPKRALFAWPNIWAGEEIVPELVGRLEPKTVADQAIDLLQHPEKLQHIRDRLQKARGKAGAAQKLATIVLEELQP